MNKQASATSNAQLDLSDVEWRVGHIVGGGQQWDPLAPSDIRRWVMAMDYPNPIHWDVEVARTTKFGGLVATATWPRLIRPPACRYICRRHRRRAA